MRIDQQQNTNQEKIPYAFVIPVYNEAECLDEFLSEWLPVVDRHLGKMILINDGSKDQTPEILNRWAGEYPHLIEVIHKENEGHGPSVLRGLKRAMELEASWIFQTDSDLQFPARHFDEFIKRKDEADYVIGYRLRRKDPLMRLLISRTLMLINLVFFKIYIRDINCPYRLISKEHLKSLINLVPSDCLIPNIHLVILARKLNLKVISLPIGHRARSTGQTILVSFNLLKFVVRSFLGLLKLLRPKPFKGMKAYETT